MSEQGGSIEPEIPGAVMIKVQPNGAGLRIDVYVGGGVNDLCLS
jgi:hypothetical protein